MPKFLEDKLRREGEAQGLTGEHLKHYIYGGMNTAGAMHGNTETKKGAKMDRKHQRDVAAGRKRG